jgi:hypothetical protein
MAKRELRPTLGSMSEEIRPPLVLLERRSYEGIFGSVADLMGYVEPIDVRNGEFTVFDADGQEVILTAESDDGPVSATRGTMSRPDDLRVILAESMRPQAVKLGLVDTDLALGDLLRVAWLQEHPRAPFPG